MKSGGTGGGNTKTGLLFEKSASLREALKTAEGYSIKDVEIGSVLFYQEKEVGRFYPQHSFYKFLESQGVDWKKIVSKRLLPDDALYVITNNTLFVIEIKHQGVGGSVDEKLQTCDFKKKQYRKLVAQLNYEVEFIYILGDWFKDSKYKDTLDYVIHMGCQYYFSYIPLHKLGLPIASAQS